MKTNRGYPTVCVLLVLSLLGGCAVPATEPTPAQQAPATTTVRLETTPAYVIATPPFTADEAPLQAAELVIPEVWIVSSRQSKRALAEYLYHPESQEDLQRIIQQLDWVNPGLPDTLLPGTMVVIPPTYLVTQAEPLAAIAEVMGIPEDTVVAANPGLDPDTPLSEGTVVILPALYIIPQDTLLSSAANSLDTSSEALISANPGLVGTEEIRAGTVLIVPPRRENWP